MSATEPAAEQVELFDSFMLKPLDQAALLEIGQGTFSRTPEPASTDHDDEAVLDLVVLAKLRKAMPPAAVAEVFAACLSDTRRRTAEMRKMSAAGDAAAVRAAAHTIKGGAAMVGAVRIATLAAELELGIYQKDDLPPKLDGLLSACDEAERILLRYTD
jgi:HPt (histidine-containing phosphotransfer) domain-containing protein